MHAKAWREKKGVLIAIPGKFMPGVEQLFVMRGINTQKDERSLQGAS